ncbi:MAG: cobalamin biosynthesis protein [Deferrisomatales bacterium]|nr:cobalamin biosynthesis protein [Deferrisomatales bacterium]
MRRPIHAIALTRDGAALVARLAREFPGAKALAPQRFAAEVPGVEGFAEPVRAVIGRLWPEAGGFLLVMAAGIAVRSIAGLLDDKARDPAVVVLDPRGAFAIPLLSGHLGGANALAREVAAKLGAVAVITTATDAVGAPAAEVWARDHDLGVADPAGVVRVNAAWANGEPVGLYVHPELGCPELGAELDPHLAWRGSDPARAQGFTGALIAVSHRLATPENAALVLWPRCLHLGVGCRRAAEPERVADGVRAALAAAGLAEGAVADVASVDAKADEPALHALAAMLGVAFRVFPSAELGEVDVPSPSARVSRAVGTASVSEAAALVASGGGELLLPKQKDAVWTLAVALGKQAGGRLPRDAEERT